MIGKSQDNVKSGRKNRLFRGCSQVQFNGGRVFHHGGGRYIPPLTSRPTIPVVAPERRPPLLVWCEICKVKLSSQKNVEQHNNGKRHRSLLKQHEELQSQKALNGQENGQMLNSLMNLVVQPEEVQESKKNGCLVENVSSGATVSNHKDYLQKDTGENSKDPAEEPDGAPRDNFAAQFEHVLDSQIQVSEATAHHEIQNSTGETKDRSRSISVELDVPAGSSINTQTEDVSSDSAAIAILPPLGPTASQAFASTPAVRSNFEPQTQHVLHTQILEAIEQYENQNPTEETNVQLPSSVFVEFNALAGCGSNTQTADGSSEAEENMLILTTELGITRLAKVAICLKCGDRGFPETLVFCSKCQVYALHRYCLDGPVIFVEDVTWFCEDCEAKVVSTSSHDQSRPLLYGTSDSVNLAKDPSQARELIYFINRVKKSRQRQQQIGKKLRKRKVISGSKVLLSDSHSSPHHEQTQCSDNCEEENKFKKVCETVPRDAANSSEWSDNVQISRVATNDDLDFVELDCPADAQPIADPIWRGSLYLCNQGIGTVSGLLAHLSSLACCKVLAETRLFPEVLCVDLLQRSAVWPKGFKNCGPTDQSIALYFFPENERAEKAFDKLVDDIIHLDLAMRAVVENAELLIFPSTVLPSQYRRFQAKYYLWGVFRALQTSPKTKDVACGEDTGVDKPLTCDNHSPSNTLRNSGSCGSSAQYSCASSH